MMWVVEEGLAHEGGSVTHLAATEGIARELARQAMSGDGWIEAPGGATTTWWRGIFFVSIREMPLEM